MCPNPAAVRLFRNCASKGFLLMVLLAREDKRLLFCCLSSRASRTISRNPLEAQLRNTRTAAGFGHMPSKTHAEKVLHVTFGIHKTTIFCPLEQAKPLPWRRSCETLEQQQDSGTCQAKRTPKKCFTSKQNH